MKLNSVQLFPIITNNKDEKEYKRLIKEMIKDSVKNISNFTQTIQTGLASDQKQLDPGFDIFGFTLFKSDWDHVQDLWLKLEKADLRRIVETMHYALDFYNKDKQNFVLKTIVSQIIVQWNSGAKKELNNLIRCLEKPYYSIIFDIQAELTKHYEQFLMLQQEGNYTHG